MISLIFSFVVLFSPLSAQSVCLTEKLVTDVVVAESGETVLVAVLTEPIYTKSEGDALTERLYNKVSFVYPNREIIISRECLVYSRLKLAESEGDSDTIVKVIDKEKLKSKCNSVA
jgi:hypothetical protein